jgi:demethylmenaquinone methyltransferase/2-methoxy-6-polyprenyl-1,4-benzoquinol methylase
MTNLTLSSKRAQNVRRMFTGISGNYDRMNRLMTAGFDRVLRRKVIHQAQLKTGMRVLDLGTGTGDLARLAYTQAPGIRIAAADFTQSMMLAGRKNGDLPFINADALTVPFAESTFDVVMSGFLLRNTADLDQALKEQNRVLKPGGRIVVLDTTRPTRSLLTPFVWFHMHAIIPTLGWLVSRDRSAYTYLSDSSERFLSAEELAKRLKQAGFIDVDYKRYLAGTIAIHWGKKTSDKC